MDFGSIKLKKNIRSRPIDMNRIRLQRIIGLSLILLPILYVGILSLLSYLSTGVSPYSSLEVTLMAILEVGLIYGAYMAVSSSGKYHLLGLILVLLPTISLITWNYRLVLLVASSGFSDFGARALAAGAAFTIAGAVLQVRAYIMAKPKVPHDLPEISPTAL